MVDSFLNAFIFLFILVSQKYLYICKQITNMEYGITHFI